MQAVQSQSHASHRIRTEKVIATTMNSLVLFVVVGNLIVLLVILVLWYNSTSEPPVQAAQSGGPLEGEPCTDSCANGLTCLYNRCVVDACAQNTIYTEYDESTQSCIDPRCPVNRYYTDSGCKCYYDHRDNGICVPSMIGCRVTSVYQWVDLCIGDV